MARELDPRFGVGTIGPSQENVLDVRTEPALVQRRDLQGAFAEPEHTHTTVDVVDIGVLPAVGTVTKTIGASPYDAVFTFSRPEAYLSPVAPVEEWYRLTVYEPTGTTPRRFFDVIAPRGTSRVRDFFVDYPAAYQTADGYTPGATETFWVDVRAVNSAGESGPTSLQEI